MVRARRATAAARLLSPLLAALLLVTVLGGAAPAAPSEGDGTGSCGADVLLTMWTFHVRLEAEKGAVRAGREATLHVRVSRPAREDPLGLSLGPTLDPPSRIPAEDVNLGVSITHGSHRVAVLARTGEDGTATATVRIPRKFPTGEADASAFAWNTVVGGCLIVEEVGKVRESGLLEVRRPRKKGR